MTKNADRFIAISLGWGIQSTTLAFMVALGELPPVDVAIHADTTHERSATYEFAARWIPWLEERGVRVVTVRGIHTDPLRKNSRFRPQIPAFANSPKGGQITRQCTFYWKISPIRRYLQQYRNRQPVELQIGISLDEALRMKSADVKYITHRWPLIEMRMTRNDCRLWLERHGLEVPPKSHCTFCPFQSKSEWRQTMSHPSDREEAIKVDEAIRKARPPYDLYVSSQRKPLIECDFRSPEDKGQMPLWENEECSGMCFL